MTRPRSFVKSHNFTLLELLFVIAIIGILTGMMMPSYGRVKEKANFIRWFSYNSQLNRDPKTVVNFNFQRMNYGTKVDGVWTPCLENNAAACEYEGFDTNKYTGALINVPEWLPGGGRWREKNAIQFDGANDYIQIPAPNAVDFLRDVDDFTIYAWVYYYGDPSRYLVSKGTSFRNSQFAVYISGSNPCANISDTKELWEDVTLEEERWYQLALVNVAGEGMRFYINGKRMMDVKNITNKPGIDLKLNVSAIIGARCVQASRKVRDPVTKIRTTEYYLDPSDFFRGKMDEFVIIRRAMSDKEIEQSYDSGRPN
jgi:Concanavalin A-like lectin/glucanases superfamily